MGLSFLLHVDLRRLAMTVGAMSGCLMPPSELAKVDLRLLSLLQLSQSFLALAPALDDIQNRARQVNAISEPRWTCNFATCALLLAELSDRYSTSGSSRGSSGWLEAERPAS